MKKIIELIKKNYVISAGILLLICLFVGVTVFMINKGTNALSEEITNGILLQCPDVVATDSEINCDVIANIVDTTVMSVNANYNFPDGITASKFSVNTECDEGYCFEEYANTENGFALTNLNGINKSVTLGVLTLKLNSSLSSNTTYDIGFKNVEYSDNEYKMISLADTKTQVRTLSDVNTLSSVEIDGTFDKEFNSDTVEYKITVDSNVDKIKIKATATDEKAKISGDTAETSLHYGTNSLKIIVTSESGKEKTYTFNVYREYEFGTDSYVYNKGKNVLFTGSVVDNDKIIDGLSIENGLSKKIVDGKLEILYGDEVVSTVGLANFKYENTVSGKVLCIEKDLSYESFISKLTLNKINVKLINGNDEEISIGNIDDNMKMNIYLDDVLIDTYTFTYSYLKLDEGLNVNEEKKFFGKQKAGTKISELKSKIDTSGSVNYISRDGTVVQDSDIIKTGDTVSIDMDGKKIEYKVVVYGDVTGDGEVLINDVTKIYRYLKGRISSDEYGDVNIAASDVTGDGEVLINDVTKMYRFIKGKLNSLQ